MSLKKWFISKLSDSASDSDMILRTRSRISRSDSVRFGFSLLLSPSLIVLYCYTLRILACLGNLGQLYIIKIHLYHQNGRIE